MEWRAKEKGGITGGGVKRGVERRGMRDKGEEVDVCVLGARGAGVAHQRLQYHSMKEPSSPGNCCQSGPLLGR